ncbi:MAG: sugar kinase [Anaerolineae bacterium]
MLRLSPPDVQRFTQAQTFEVVYGGAEANVALSLATFGAAVRYISRLPQNDLGDACLNALRQFGVDTEYIVRGGERLGIYFYEKGAAQRGGKVIYDRAGSAFATITPGMINWQAVFAEADWFHWSGISPAVSQSAAETTAEALEVAQSMGLTISCDLNYRHTLWKWGKTPGEVLPELLSRSQVFVGNQESVETVFGLRPESPLDDLTAREQWMCEQVAAHFPNLHTIATTVRTTLSASHNRLGGVLWHRGQHYTTPPYDITPIIDRVGGGDSFMAGLIYGLRRYESKQDALHFAVAASVLKHAIIGDANLATVPEVEGFMGGSRRMMSR